MNRRVECCQSPVPGDITGPSHLGVYGPCGFIRCVIEKVKKTARLGSESSAFDGRVLLGLDRLGLNPVSQRHVTSGSGTAGNTYDSAGNFPAVGYTKGDFHTCAKNIADYSNADEVQNCRLSGLQDLDTSQDHVQDTIADYLATLLDMGVYGFRVDAVKHIAAQDVAAIKAKLAAKTGRDVDGIFFEQEVIGNGSEAASIQPVNYLATGKVSESTYNKRLPAVFGGSITVAAGGLDAIGGPTWVDSDKAAVWVTNWDTERNGSSLTTRDGTSYLLQRLHARLRLRPAAHLLRLLLRQRRRRRSRRPRTSVPDMTCPTDGTFTATVAKDSAVALYAGATPANWTGTRKYDPSDPAWFTGETPHKGDDTAAKSADSAASAKSGDAKSGKATSDAIRRAATLAAILLPVIACVTFMAIARRNGKAQSDNSGPNND